MYPERFELDLAIHVDGAPTPSTTYLTTVGVGAFCVVVDTRVPELRGFRLVSSYLGWPGDASASTHRLSFDDTAPVTTRRTFLRPPASADECIRDHMTQLQDRIEEQDVSMLVGCAADRTLYRLG
ncbi:hypothetical protein [Conexibacter woesei]|uniref:hypothetical protein n=1 Tax=Conexibacter woesei TaxID=191495 RepID=UPI00040CBE4A|nr:hypothetical protein [Conexibacter woesei]